MEYNFVAPLTLRYNHFTPLKNAIAQKMLNNNVTDYSHLAGGRSWHSIIHDIHIWQGKNHLKQWNKPKIKEKLRCS